MITIENLVKLHGQNRILNGVNLTVNQGEVVTLIGPSGGGKSTLLRCINGLEVFQAGRIAIAPDLGIDSQKLPTNMQLREIRLRVGMVFQQFNLFPHLTALKNVMAGPVHALGVPESEAAKTAIDLLERVGLRDKIDSRPGQLSGGQQQRVAIARALAVKPKAILFDEPTSALDPKSTDEVLDVIADLAKNGQTMIVVTHAMDFAKRVSHRVGLMAGGRIAEIAPPQELFERPVAPETKEFISRIHH